MMLFPLGQNFALPASRRMRPWQARNRRHLVVAASLATAATPPLHVAKERQKKKRPDLAPGPDLSLQGKAKAGYLKPWTDALKKARKNLGITGPTPSSFPRSPLWIDLRSLLAEDRVRPATKCVQRKTLIITKRLKGCSVKELECLVAVMKLVRSAFAASGLWFSRRQISSSYTSTLSHLRARLVQFELLRHHQAFLAHLYGLT
jgi:hypothetical protein